MSNFISDVKQSVMICFLVLTVACQQKFAESAEANRPNIVLIMADDLGYQGITCYGNSEIRTPHLDALAHDGIQFTDYHSNGSVCSPTRAALMTGRYQQRSGLEGVIYARGPTRQTGLDTLEITLPELLRANGYATGIAGKWHLGYQPEYNPIHHGFDEFRGYISGNIDYHSHYDNTGVFDWWHDLDTVREDGYVTDLITEHAVNFIKTNHNVPFFLYVSHEAPHVPFQSRTDPAYRFTDNDFTYYGPVEDQNRAYKEMIEIMDEGIGKITSTLEELDLTNNTLIVFVSDNGAESFGHNGDLHGDKGSLYEGGHRVPALVYWKSTIQPAVTDEMVMSFDWMPTFLSLASAGTPQSHHLDGVDLSPLLLERKALPQRNLFWKYRDQAAIRQNQ
ncbi:MAG: sulfatase-like hydrolase/transferase, partial [Saprospiraceae bacterium]|nr:sulfatase-like hydrolase/transferase [Saprospiraceae bacterium]